jgi:hypothetical protein
MNISTRINELVDNKRNEEALDTLNRSKHEIRSGDLSAVSYLLQRSVINKQMKIVAGVMKCMALATVRLPGVDFYSGMQSLMRNGSVEQAIEVMNLYLDKGIAIEVKSALVFVEGCFDNKAFDQARDFLARLVTMKLPLDESFWVTVVRGFLRSDEIYHTQQVLYIIGYPTLSSLRLWEDYLDACIRIKTTSLAIETLNAVSSSGNKISKSGCWNLLLRKAGGGSDVTDQDLQAVIDNILAQSDVIIDENALSLALNKLVKLNQEGNLIHYVKQARGAITNFVLSSLIALLIEKNLPRQALELVHLVNSEFFGRAVNLDSLSLTNEKLKIIIREQQKQM